MSYLYAGYADNCLHSFHRAADYVCNVDYASYARYSSYTSASYASHTNYTSYAGYAGDASCASYAEYFVDNSSTENNYADYFHLVAELAKLVVSFDVLFQLLQN